MHHLWFLFKSRHDCFCVQHAVADGVVNLVEYHHIPVAGENSLATLVPCFFHHADVFGVGLSSADFDETTPKLLHNKVVAKGLNRIEFSVMPGAFEELKHQDFHAVPHSTEGRSHSRSRFSLASTGIDDNKTAADVRHHGLYAAKTTPLILFAVLSALRASLS